ncbi:MAG: GNVR domain-containing protein, partial [Acidimicrobiales bacterium]
DYDVLKKNYGELIQRRQSAELASAAETKNGNAEFRVIDPPRVPAKPITPNRPLLVAGVLFAGLAASLGLPLLLAKADRSFATAMQLHSLGRQVIGSVSRFRRARDSRRIAIEATGVGASGLALLAVFVVLISISLGQFGP